MDAHGMQNIPLEVVSVFTSRGVTVKTSHHREVFDTEGLIAYLKEMAVQDGELDPSETALKLNEQVQRIKKK